jgi:hypothetical protein
LRQLFRLMRPVGVHFDQHLIAGVQPPFKTGQVCRAEAFLAESVHDMDMVIGGRDLIGQLAGAVG